jgi:Uma2 family endonuclease
MSTATAISPAPPTIAPVEDGHYEVVNGRRVETPRMGSYESDIANELVFWINDYFSSTRKRLGRLEVEVLFRIDEASDLQRRPDLAFVSYDRWPKRKRAHPADAWNVVPDLAVEVVSRHNTASEINEKIQDYFRCGVRMVWVIYPAQVQVYVYDSPTKVSVIEKAGTLQGGDVLPGFQLPLVNLFATE